MHKFATVYKAAMRKRGGVDPVRWAALGSADVPRALLRGVAAFNTAANLLGPTTPAQAKATNLLRNRPNHEDDWRTYNDDYYTTARPFIDSNEAATLPDDWQSALRQKYPATHPILKEDDKFRLRQEQHKLQDTPKETMWSQLPEALVDRLKTWTR